LSNDCPDWRKLHDQPGNLLSNTCPYNVPRTFTKSFRTQEWRYIWYADGFEGLFDHRLDPREWINRAGDPAYTHALAHWRRQCHVQQLLLDDPRSPADNAKILSAFPEWQI